MARVKGGPQGHLRHKRVLKFTKGQFGSRHRLIRRANEARLKSMWYATRDRKNRKRDLRRLVDYPYQRWCPPERYLLQPLDLRSYAKRIFSSTARCSQTLLYAIRKVFAAVVEKAKSA